jgi:two-component system, OmpR family, response regulator ChvI
MEKSPSSTVNPKILVVDDEPDFILTLRLGLEQNGFSVDTYEDPALALSQFKSNYYDLIIIDVRMAKMNGFELYQQIRKKQNDVKTCFITAHETYYELLKNEFPKINVGCFLSKPIEIDVLVEKIREQLKK